MQKIEPNMDGAALRIGIVMSRFNDTIGAALLQAALDELLACGVKTANITQVSVPGALEIPLALQKLASGGMVDALIALGAVIRGDTYHFEIVANESASGVSAVQLDTGVPVANGILTTNTEAQAIERMAQKGKEAAQAAIEMANLLKWLDEAAR